MYSVYILESLSFGKYYIGQTNNLEKRLISHNLGQNKYTKSYIPWKIIFHKHFESRAMALMVEKKLKALKKRELVVKFAIENQFTAS